MPVSSSSTAFESPKLSRIARMSPSSGNSSGGDTLFSLKKLVQKARRSRTPPTSNDNDAPPPPPPKDEPKRSFSPSFYSAGAKRSTSTEGSHGSRGNMSNGYSHKINFTLAEVHISSHPSNPGLNSQSITSQSVSPVLPPKFEPFRRPSGPPIKLPTPAERAKARIEAEREKELKFRSVIQQEEENKARKKAEKEEQLRREEEEEARRKAKMEQDIRIAQLLKKQREYEQAKADEKFAQEVEERRKANREKRIQETNKSQAWRSEHERSKEKTLHEKEEERKRKEEEKRQERKNLFETMKTEHSDGLELSGWISVQSAGTVTWRRRWFIFDGKTLKFFKAQNDASPVDIITVSDISDVRDGGDPSEEEPAFIQNSFTIEELHKLRWSLFTDTPETMEKVMAALLFSLNIPSAGHS